MAKTSKRKAYLYAPLEAGDAVEMTLGRGARGLEVQLLDARGVIHAAQPLTRAEALTWAQYLIEFAAKAK